LLAAYRRLPDPPPLELVGRHLLGERDRLPAKVTFLGPVPHEQALQVITGARLVVVPSILPDCCPTVVLEVVALGARIVATATGGIPDMLTDGVSGLLVGPGDERAISRVLMDYAGATARAREAKSQMVRFGESAVIAAVESLYRDLLSHGRFANR
jgi:glycosyltransferase involved in cell wall biosynthesis